MTPDVMGKTLFDTTIDDRMYAEGMKLFGSTDQPIFEGQERDTTIYSLLMPEIDSCKRNDLKILRIELMYFAFAFIDFVLMRSAKLHEELGQALCFEAFHWYVWEFKKRIEPSGRSAEFLVASEDRLRAYNKAWDQMLVDGDRRNRQLIEETLFRFCEPETPVINVMLYFALNRELSATQSMLVKFFETHRFRK